MRIPNALSPEAFLASYWQKGPLFMPAALDGIRPSLSPDELAWLATQEDVESRLVMTQGDGEDMRYQVRHGPFREDVLSSLPRQNWTLLVQDVEKHLPDFRALTAAADFIPDWRIDDLMVSFAAPGGSVGPHRDNYDVFLCQGEGQREWRIGDQDHCIPDTSSEELSLVRQFVDERPQTASDGDVLYLPPGIPHWGIAQDFCMTYSIGMRAPSLAELNAGAARLFDIPVGENLISSATGADDLYEDPDLTIDEAVPGLISAAAIRRARNTLRKSVPLEEQQVAMILGTVATDPKAWLAPECVSDDEANSVIGTLEQKAQLSVHGMARIAFSDFGKSGLIFANGYARRVSPDRLDSFREVCSSRSASRDQLCADNDTELLRWLLASGVFDLTEQAV